MEIFFVIFVVMIGFVLVMSVGVILGREPISGSCGGMKKLGMDVACEICGGDDSKCDKKNGRQEETGDTKLGYDAMTKHF